PVLDTWIRGASASPRMPKNLFAPAFGFAWDPRGSGKTAVRGGFFLAYDANVSVNLGLESHAMLPPGVGAGQFAHNAVFSPDGAAINVDGAHPDGDYSDLEGQPLKNVIGTIGQLYLAVDSAFKNSKF